jgi:hypothetical protein
VVGCCHFNTRPTCLSIRTAGKIIALPTGILASGFKEELGKNRGKPKVSEDIKNGLEDISVRLARLEKSININSNQLN